MKILLNFFVAFFILKFDIIVCFSFCDIQFPKPLITFSTRFDLFTNHEKESFTKISSYIPEKTYDVSVLLNKKSIHQHLTIKEIYVLASNIQSDITDPDENEWKNGGEVVFNVTHASKTEYCSQRAHVQYLYTQPQHVTFYWIAPKTPKLCIRITVILNMNDVDLENIIEEKSHTICEETLNRFDQMQGDQDESTACTLKPNPDPVKRCDIGSTAVYRMTIESKWNSLTHWKDWPGKDGYTPKFTQYLGASHSKDFNIYHIGGKASNGVLEVCSNGSYNELQKQFYKAGNGIMTVILARSLDASSITNKRSALIVVNATQHLVSFLARIEPSPDWCTGLSRYDLCDGKCKWPEKLTIPLYPWDAGIYNGETYLYKKEKHNQTPICPITSSWPNGNPFTVLNGEIQSIGLVTFQLIQEYNKNSNQYCNSANFILLDEADPNEQIPKSPYASALKANPEKTRHCLMTPWSEWSACSKSCGKGEKVRYRQLVKGKPEKCIESTYKDVETCNHKCLLSTPYETCSLRLWGQWSPCNATCSQKGVVYRERVFINELEKQECMMFSNMKSIFPCSIALDRCNSETVCREYVNDGDSCLWSSPSHRYYYDISTGTCNSFLYKGCNGGLNNFHTYNECNSLCRSQTKDFIQSQFNAPVTYENRCNVSMTWGVLCDSQESSDRWYYDNINKDCYKFRFGGCRGNANNFKTKAECQKVCLTKSIITTPINQLLTIKQVCTYSTWSDWSPCTTNCQNPQKRFRLLMEKNDDCTENLNETRKCPCNTPRNCKYSNWSEWTACSSRCGQGVRERKRMKLSTNSCKPEFPQFTDRESCYNSCMFY